MALPYAYVVRGSADGNIGVFSSAKRAKSAGMRYLMNAGIAPELVKEQYSFKKHDMIELSNWEEFPEKVEIERFILE